LVPLATDLGTELSRAQYLALYRAGLTTPAAIKSTDPDHATGRRATEHRPHPRRAGERS
jgi:hypothetical protein